MFPTDTNYSKRDGLFFPSKSLDLLLAYSSEIVIFDRVFVLTALGPPHCELTALQVLGALPESELYTSNKVAHTTMRRLQLRHVLV